MLMISWWEQSWFITKITRIQDIYIYIYTGRTKVALVELPTVNMFGFFFCTPFPRRILAWSFVVPRSHFHPPKALTSYIFKRWCQLTVPHLPHKTDLKMWSAVDRDGCFVKLSRSMNFVPPGVYIYIHMYSSWGCSINQRISGAPFCVYVFNTTYHLYHKTKYWCNR